MAPPPTLKRSGPPRAPAAVKPKSASKVEGQRQRVVAEDAIQDEVSTGLRKVATYFLAFIFVWPAVGIGLGIGVLVYFAIVPLFVVPAIVWATLAQSLVKSYLSLPKDVDASAYTRVGFPLSLCMLAPIVLLALFGTNDSVAFSSGILGIYTGLGFLFHVGMAVVIRKDRRFSTLRKPSSRVRNNLSNSLEIIVVVINFIQLCGIVFRLDEVPWHSSFSQGFRDFFSVFLLDLRTLGLSSQVSVFVAAGIAFVPLFLQGIAEALGTFRFYVAEKVTMYAVDGWMATVGRSAYLGILTELLSVLECDFYSTSGRMTYFRDVSQACFEGDHTLVAGIALLVLYMSISHFFLWIFDTGREWDDEIDVQQIDTFTVLEHTFYWVLASVHLYAREEIWAVLGAQSGIMLGLAVAYIVIRPQCVWRVFAWRGAFLFGAFIASMAAIASEAIDDNTDIQPFMYMLIGWAVCMLVASYYTRTGRALARISEEHTKRFIDEDYIHERDLALAGRATILGKDPESDRKVSSRAIQLRDLAVFAGNGSLQFAQKYRLRSAKTNPALRRRAGAVYFLQVTFTDFEEREASGSTSQVEMAASGDGRSKSAKPVERTAVNMVQRSMKRQLSSDIRQSSGSGVFGRQRSMSASAASGSEDNHDADEEAPAPPPLSLMRQASMKNRAVSGGARKKFVTQAEKREAERRDALQREKKEIYEQKLDRAKSVEQTIEEREQQRAQEINSRKVSTLTLQSTSFFVAEDPEKTLRDLNENEVQEMAEAGQPVFKW